MWIRFTPTLLVITFLSGCSVASVAPLVPAADAAFDPRLLGTWQDSSGKEFVVITALPPKGYALAYTDGDGKTGRFEALLGHVGSLLVLDVTPDDPSLDASDLYKSLLLPLHGVIVIDSMGPQLRVRMLEPDSVKRYLERQPNLISHEMREESVVLTAPTAALRTFLTTIARRPGALGEPGVWQRRSP